MGFQKCDAHLVKLLECIIFIGLLCHLDDACASDPCHVGAICDTSPIDGTYICSCPSGFKGVDCTQDVDECEEGMYLYLLIFICFISLPPLSYLNFIYQPFDENRHNTQIFISL